LGAGRSFASPSSAPLSAHEASVAICSAVAAAEFSFLLALPTLGAATLYDFLKHRQELLTGASVGLGATLVGLVVAAVVAVIAIRSFLRYLTRHGLEPFGWYRIALALAIVAFLWHHVVGLG